jgi:Spy/CpxP family protein refolding chaperone
MRNLKTVALGLLLASLITTPAYAKRHGGDTSCNQDDCGMKPLEKLEKTLDLTAKQQAEIRAILAESRAGMAARGKEVRANRAAIRDTLSAATLDESRLRELLRKQTELQADRMVAQHAVRARIKQALTAKQQATWDEFRRQRTGHRGGHDTPGRWSEPDRGGTAM